MTVRTETRVTGAECLEVVCWDDECVGKLGNKIIHQNHKGYEHDDAEPSTTAEMDTAILKALAHDEEHDERHEIVIFHFKVK